MKQPSPGGAPLGGPKRRPHPRKKQKKESFHRSQSITQEGSRVKRTLTSGAARSKLSAMELKAAVLCSLLALPARAQPPAAKDRAAARDAEWTSLKPLLELGAV